jgi:O-antigen ligase
MPAATYLLAKIPRLDDRQLTQGAVLIPLFAGLIMPGTPSWAFIFYITAIPPILLNLWRGWRPDFSNPAFAAMLSLWFWSAATILWNHHTNPHGKTTMFWIVNALWTLVLMANFLSAMQQEPRTRSRAMAAMVYGGAANAIISLVLFVIKGHLTVRLWGWGETGNPVMGAAIMDICLLLALCEGTANPRRRLPMAIAALPMILYLSLSYSRAALIALAAAMLVIFLGRRPLLAILASLAIAVAALVLWKFGAELFPMLWSNLASRGDDCHAELWRAAWQAIRANPVFGYGPSATLPNLTGVYCPPYPSPHNLYLSLLFYSGGVGLILFVATVLLLWRHLHAATSGFARRLWLAIGLVPLIVGMTDLVQIIKGPSPMWYIVWMPMLLVLTLPKASVERTRIATTAYPLARAQPSAQPADALQRFVR